MSKGKKQRITRPIPELQDGATPSTNGPGLTTSPQRTGSVNRLPSLRPKRDLTLGGSAEQTPKPPKKTFTPTIPVRRKKVPSTPQTPTDEGSSPHEREKGKGRGRERSRGGRGGRGGRRDREVITSASVFSMGPAERVLQKRELAGGTFGSFARTEKSENAKAKSETGTKYNAHYSDNDDDEEGHHGCSISGGVMEVGGEQEEQLLFSGSNLPPVQLPLDYSLHTKHRAVVTKNKLKHDMEDVSKQDIPVKKPVKPVFESTSSQSKPKKITAPQLFTPSEGSKGQFLFFQLPDCIPVGGMKDNVAMDTSTRQDVPSSSSSLSGAATSSASTSGGRENDGEMSLPTLRDLQDGLIGKIKVHKSGKVKLVLGDISLDITMGTPCGFLQELVSIRTDSERQEISVLGQMAHRLICTPDFESLLNSETNCSSSSDHEQYR